MKFSEEMLEFLFKNFNIWFVIDNTIDKEEWSKKFRDILPGDNIHRYYSVLNLDEDRGGRPLGFGQIVFIIDLTDGRFVGKDFCNTHEEIIL